MMVLPFLYLLFKHPDSVSAFFAFGGEDGANGKGVNFGSVMLAAGVCLSLIAQIAEQIDYLRFMPPKTPENTRRWWAAVILAGPGWVIFGAFKQIVGLFLAVYIIANVVDGSSIANQPVHQFLEIYQDMMPHWLAMTLAVILVVISQIKINVTNAYSGSLAWTNSYTRVTKTYPRTHGLRSGQPGDRTDLDGSQHVRLPQHDPRVLRQLRYRLGRGRRLGHRDQQVLVEALPRKSPPSSDAGCSTTSTPSASCRCCWPRAFRSWCSSVLSVRRSSRSPPIVAIVIALVMPPILAVATKGKYYLRRTDDGIDLPMFDEYGNPSGETLLCCVSGIEFERPDMLASNVPGPNGEKQYISSLALSTDKTGEHVLPAQLP